MEQGPDHLVEDNTPSDNSHNCSLATQAPIQQEQYSHVGCTCRLLVEQGHLHPQSYPRCSQDDVTNKCPIQESCSSSYEDDEVLHQASDSLYVYHHQSDLGRFTSQQRYRPLGRPITRLEGHCNGASADHDEESHQKEGKIRLLEDKSSRQVVEIKTLQTQIQHHGLQTTNSVTTWDTVMSAATLKHNSGNLELASLSSLEKRYEDIERQVTMLKVHVSDMELQLQASLASTYNGSFIWRIPDLSRRKRDAIDGRITSLYSPPFYTAKHGYKMCIRVYLNGDGMGHKTHLSLFFVLMKGEFDALLKWPFENKVSLILVDQNHRKHLVQTFKPTPESSSFQRPISNMNVVSGCPQFCKLSVLNDDNYTKDDVVFIKCIVDTAHIFHP